MSLQFYIKRFQDFNEIWNVKAEDETDLKSYLAGAKSEEEKLKKICELKENGNIDEFLKDRDCDLGRFNMLYEETFIDPWKDEVFYFSAMPETMSLTDEDISDDEIEVPKPGGSQKPKNAMDSIRTIWKDELRKRLKDKNPDVSGSKILQIAKKLQITIYDNLIKSAKTKEEIVTTYYEALDQAEEKSEEMIPQ